MSSSFYIGQRVRVVHTCAHFSRYLGVETIIVGRPPFAEPEAWELAGVHPYAESWTITPIQDDLESAEEIDALYEPSPEVIRARNASLIAEQLANIGMRRAQP